MVVGGGGRRIGLTSPQNSGQLHSRMGSGHARSSKRVQSLQRRQEPTSRIGVRSIRMVDGCTDVAIDKASNPAYGVSPVEASELIRVRDVRSLCGEGS